MILLQHADAYGTSLQEARRFTEEEKPQYAEWFRNYGFVSIAGTQERLPHVGWEDLPKRSPDGEFRGCTNRAWILTDEEAEHFRNLEAERARAEQEKKEAEERARAKEEAQRAAEEAKIRAQFDSWDVTSINNCTVLHTFWIKGEQLDFYERDIFDFGVVINPAYPVAPGLLDGGLCLTNKDGVMVWNVLSDESVPKDVRPLTENEAACIKAIRRMGRFAGGSVRM